jgi:hypothetical protein
MVLFFINAILSLVISLILILYFFRNLKKPSFSKIRDAAGILGLLYLVFSIILILLSLGLVGFYEGDYSSMISVFLLLQSFILFYIIYQINKDKRISFFLFTFMLVLLYFYISLKYTIIFTSAVFTSIIFIYYTFLSQKKLSGVIGILYALISLVIYLISFLFEQAIYIVSIISNLFFIAFLFVFLRDLSKNKRDIVKKNHKKKNYYIVSFVKYLIFILVLVNLIFIATLGAHEAGHLVFSKIYGCNYGRVVYDIGMPRTEILCEENLNTNIIVLGGIIFPMLLAILLFIGGGKFIKEIALIIFGFNLVFAYQDLLDLLVPESVAVFILLLGVVEVGIGISLLAKSRTEEELPSLEQHIHNGKYLNSRY